MKATRVCSSEGCDRTGQMRQGMCDTCYRRAKRRGELSPVIRTRKPCSVPGCELPSRAYGMCPVHYGRFRHHGDTDPSRRRSAADVWERVVETADGCLEWQGARSSAGYGQMWAGGRLQYTHRLAYEAAFGSIPDGLLVCHHCDNPPCCNPNHYFLGTHADNAADKVAKGRHLPRREWSA